MNQNVLDARLPVKYKKEPKTHNIVELLKNNIMEDSSLSDMSQHGNELKGHTKAKKSLFATLIKRKHTKKTPKVRITKKIETCSTINIETESATSDQEVAGYQIAAQSEKYCEPIKALTQSPEKPKRKHRCFLHKIIKKSKIENELLPPPESGTYNQTGDGDKNDYELLEHLNHFVPTAYLPKYNVKLINSMNELQNVLQNLQFSEEHFIYLLKKYIEDPNFHEQLMENCCQYLSLQSTAKSQTNALADGLWTQHLEMAKVREENLQKKLNLLVKANRALQFKSENMCRHCEKLAARTNLYPKRFLHMRSFGKIYARHLIDNNRKLQTKLKTLTVVVSDFEEEMQKLQEQKSELEEERRKAKSQIYHLEGIIDRDRSDHELERLTLIKKLTFQSRLIKDGEHASKCLLQEILNYQNRAQELGVGLKKSHHHSSDVPYLPELIDHIRSHLEDLFVGVLSAFGEITAAAKDVNRLRSTNARLQENLQKSANELNNLSKKLEKHKEVDVNTFESKYTNLLQENFALQMELNACSNSKQKLEEDLHAMKKALEEAAANIKETSSQNSALQNQITQVARMVSQLDPDVLEKEFPTNQDKLEYLRLRYTQADGDKKQLSVRCNSLEEENQTLLQSQEMYQQDISSLQEAINIISAEHDVLKKQLAAEHQTVMSLQSERVKYLEEKSILKTIFQHMKGEISKIQQLEGAVADMTKETSRLAIIAEFNKQLGEQLKSEVEEKDLTILQLRQSLEKLSHLQIDNDKEKIQLCAQLSEASSTKDKLRDCLEIELKKNLELDECKKKLESSTQSQLQVYEEMQRNERAALKELLKDFKGLTKQRDALLLLCEQNKKTHQSLEKRIDEWKRKHEQAMSQVKEKEAEIRRLTEKVEEMEVKIKEIEEGHQNNDKHYEKTFRKMDKLLGQLRNEKGELESSNNYLKVNLQKVQEDLDKAREKERELVGQVNVKSAEVTTIGTELTTYKNELQTVNQENGKLKTEIEFLNKIYEKQTQELNNLISQFSSKDHIYLESQNTMLTKEEQISQLNKVIFELESKVTHMEQQCNYLKKQNEDQNRIMINYENQLVLMADVEASKLKLEKQLHNIQLEHNSTLSELENCHKEVERLNKELQDQVIKYEKDKSSYQKKANELLLNYTQQKLSIEDEIEIISKQLEDVTENFHNEKYRFEELTKVHEELKEKFVQMKNKLSDEVTAHQETCRKLANTDNVIKALADEKEALQKQINCLLVDLREERDNSAQLSKEISRFQTILDQGRQQYSYILTKNTTFENEIKQLKHELESMSYSKDRSQHEIDLTASKLEEKTAELKAAKETIERLKKELAGSQKALIDLKEDFFNLQQKVTGLEFKNCELTLQIHESHAKLETERNLYRDLKQLKNRDENTPMASPGRGGAYF